MDKCIPKCWKKNDGGSSSSGANLPSEQQCICFKCHCSQSVARGATVFVCSSCHAVNRLTPEIVVGLVDSSMPPLVPTGNEIPDLSSKQLVSLRRINSSTFLPLSDAPIAGSESAALPPTPTTAGNAGSAGIGPCSICLDAPGDMIFMDCNHGGFCESCARHIASNKAVGGACCVKCRSPIEKVMRIVQIDRDTVKAVTIEVQTDTSGTNQPPRVPPPRGYNKAKKR